VWVVRHEPKTLEDRQPDIAGSAVGTHGVSARIRKGRRNLVHLNAAQGDGSHRGHLVGLGRLIDDEQGLDILPMQP
jgi:hypothetical protein